MRMLPIVRSGVHPETGAQCPSLRTHTWETVHFPGRGHGETLPSSTQPWAWVSVPDLGGPGRTRVGKAPPFSRDVGKFGSCTGKVTHRNSPESSAPLASRKASKAAAASELQRSGGHRLEPPGRGCEGRATSHHYSATSVLQRQLVNGSPHASGEEQTGPTLPAAPTAPAFDWLGIVVSRRPCPHTLQGSSFAFAPPPSSKATPLTP